MTSHWHRHPHVRSGTDLTRGERAADRMRNGMGSWAFVFSALAFLALWMTANVLVVHFDRYPYILLNLVLSCLAAMQGAILLIAAKRSDQVSSELAQHDYEVNVASLRYHVTQAEVLYSIAADLGVTLTDEQRTALFTPPPIPLPPTDGAGVVV